MISVDKNKTLDFQLLFESAPDLYLILKPDLPRFTIVGVNEAYLSATMTIREEILEKGLFEVFPDNPNYENADGTANLIKSLIRVIEKKQPDIMVLQKYDIPKSTGDGFEERYWSPLNTPVLNEKKEVLYIIHRVEDVTENILYKKNNLQLTQYETRINNVLNTLLKYSVLDFNLQMEVSDKGDELDAIALGLNVLGEALESKIKEVETSNTQLEAVNKELESFSYSVSHDLKAPLRAVHGYAQMLEEEYARKMDSDGLRMISVIKYNATKMGILIDDLLSFSQLGKKEVQRTEINLNELVESVLTDLGKTTSHHAEIKVGKLASVKADYGLLSQVVFNLLSNAIKYSSKKDKPVIKISSKENNDEVIFSIEDNGIGFSMKYYEKLFGVFQRLHSIEDYEGTGVGLAMVQKIISKHGGIVWADGKPNKGATFYFSIPK